MAVKIEKHIPTTRQAYDPKAMDERMKDASKMYEKLFLREMVKAMRQTVPESTLTKPSMAENIFKEKLDGEYVESWGDKGGIGLAKIIYTQLKEKFGSQNAISPPAGPLPIHQGTTIKIDNSKDFSSPTEGSKSGEEVNYIIKTSSAAENKRPQVTSPWKGSVSNIQNLMDDYKMVEIDHDGGLKSKMVFKGSVDQDLKNSQVSPGQKLGELSVSTSQLNWSIEQKS